MNDNAGLHYYCLTFIDGESNGHIYASTYAGWPEQYVNLEQIAQARRAAKVGPDAVLLSCSYLGCMSPAQFRGE